MMRRFAIAALLSSACARPELTEILVVTDTDLAVPEELTTVRFQVRGPNGRDETVIADFAAGEPRPAVLGLVRRAGLDGPFWIEVRGERAGELVVSRSARVSFVPNRVVVLSMRLLARCRDQACGELETCAESGCRSVEVSPSELEPFDGSPAPRADGGLPCALVCDDGVACTVDACHDGGCWNAPDSRLCAEDEHACTVSMCDPERGCVVHLDDAACDDGIACTVDRCDAERGCVSTPDDGVCQDGISCTEGACDPIEGCVHHPIDAECADDGIACTVERCDPDRGCVSIADHALCPPGERCRSSVGCVRGPTFGEVLGIFDSRCDSCHDDARPSADLDLSAREVAWASLVGAPAICGAGEFRVVPRDPARSLLWRKVARESLCGDRMPPTGPPLGGSDVDRIEEWIEAGALNN